MARVLVIDDDPVARCSVVMFLEDAGHEVSEAADGREGLSAFRHAPADVVITDVIMPGMDGLEMIMELWREYPQVKVIAISAGDDAIPMDMCLDHARIFGALRTFTKPIDRAGILAAVNELAA